MINIIQNTLEKLFGSLKYSHRFFLLTLTYLASFGILLSLLFLNFTPALDNAKRQLKGIELHRMFNALLVDGFDLTNHEENVNAHLHQIQNELERLSASSYLKKENLQEIQLIFDSLGSTWESILENKGNLEKQNILTEKFIQHILSLIRQNFYAFHLNLHQELKIYLDSYLTFIYFPTTQSQLISLNLIKNLDSTEWHYKIQLLLEMLHQTKGGQALSSDNEGFSEENIPIEQIPATKHYLNAIEAFIHQAMENHLQTQSYTESLQRIFHLGQELEHPLTTEIENKLLTTTAQVDLIENVTIISIFTTTLYLFILYLTLFDITSLKSLTSVINRVINGDLSARVSLTGRDELARLGEKINEILLQWEIRQNKMHRLIEDLIEKTNIQKSSSHVLIQNIESQKQAIVTLLQQNKRLKIEAGYFNTLLTNFNKYSDQTIHFSYQYKSDLKEMLSMITHTQSASIQLMDTFSMVSTNVARITDVINSIISIADQSNLLSLNTAIQANRSGEKGKGFSIVAEKIRELADEIGAATLTIEEQIKDVIRMMDLILFDINQFSNQIKRQKNNGDEIHTQLMEKIIQMEENIRIFETFISDVEIQFKERTIIQKAIEDLQQTTFKAERDTLRLNEEIKKLDEKTSQLRSLIV